MVPSPLPGVAANTIAQVPPADEVNCQRPVISTGGATGAARAAACGAGGGGGGSLVDVENMPPPQPLSAAAAPIASHRSLGVIAAGASSHGRNHELGAL